MLVGKQLLARGFVVPHRCNFPLVLPSQAKLAPAQVLAPPRPG